MSFLELIDALPHADDDTALDHLVQTVRQRLLRAEFGRSDHELRARDLAVLFELTQQKSIDLAVVVRLAVERLVRHALDEKHEVLLDRAVVARRARELMLQHEALELLRDRAIMPSRLCRRFHISLP